MAESTVEIAAMLYFATRPEWIEALRGWGYATVDVERIWIFGSRASGVRRGKEDAPAVPDLDVAYSLRGSDVDTLLGVAMFEGGKWKARLQRALPDVVLDLQYADPKDDIVWPAAQARGVLIYEAED